MFEPLNHPIYLPGLSPLISQLCSKSLSISLQYAAPRTLSTTATGRRKVWVPFYFSLVHFCLFLSAASFFFFLSVMLSSSIIKMVYACTHTSDDQDGEDDVQSNSISETTLEYLSTALVIIHKQPLSLSKLRSYHMHPLCIAVPYLFSQWRSIAWRLPHNCNSTNNGTALDSYLSSFRLDDMKEKIR